PQINPSPQINPLTTDKSLATINCLAADKSLISKACSYSGKRNTTRIQLLIRRAVKASKHANKIKRVNRHAHEPEG
ncbi:MAG: hypothetical protein ABIO21_06175, partial [Pseudomonas sp.]